MKEEPVWKIGVTAHGILIALSEAVRYVEKSPDVYLDERFFRKTRVRLQQWDLAGTDDYFACMKREEFDNLRPTEPHGPFTRYEDVDYPDSDPPHNVFGFEECAYQIAIFFEELNVRKASSDGVGIQWPKDSFCWGARDLYPYEKVLRVGNRNPPSVPFTLQYAFFNNDDKPHQVVYAWHGDEGRDGVIQRSELQILMRCMRGSIARRELCMHNIPVLLLSIHGARARIMIAHFNLEEITFDIKCSKFEQFDGFEVKEIKCSNSEQFDGFEAKEDTRDNRARPPDFEAKRDLFFRWLNPICQGETYLEDTKDGQEMVMRGRKGRKRLRPRKPAPKSSSSESSENVG